MTTPRLLCCALAAFAASCGTLKKFTPSVPLPSLPSLPDMTKVRRLLPGSSDKVDDKDPDLAFDPRGTLRPGHTLRLEIHEGLRSAKTLWKGLTVVELDGTASFGKIGSAKLRGETLSKVSEIIGSVFRVAGKTASPVAVHIISVENIPVIALDGDLAAGPQSLPLFDGATVSEALRLAGGRPSNSPARGVYVTRAGQKRFFRSAQAADDKWRLAAGDIISLSPDL